MPRSLGLVCFCVVGDDALTRALIERVNARRRVMISHTVVAVGDGGDGEEGVERWVARVAVGSSGVLRKDIDELVSEIGAVLDEVVQ